MFELYHHRLLPRYSRFDGLRTNKKTDNIRAKQLKKNIFLGCWGPSARPVGRSGVSLGRSLQGLGRRFILCHKYASDMEVREDTKDIPVSESFAFYEGFVQTQDFDNNVAVVIVVGRRS